MFGSMVETVINVFSEIDISTRAVTNIGLNDIIDILVITFVTYRVMLWIKETRAWSLLKGFLIILAIYASAYIFNLYTVRWVIQNMFSIGLIALIVIFQPELRRALEQLGRGGLIPEFVSGSSAAVRLSVHSRDEIIKAVTLLAKERTGALIAVEQEIVLKEYEQPGVMVDAAVSSELLVNIFQDKTPLHDGAVIISHNRIATACGILPLTQRNIDKELGTRHRAALGASEATDAYIIVVSEETGKISTALKGELNRDLDEDGLRAILPAADETDRRKLGILRGVTKR